jgi:hypothetical protein
MPIWKKRSTNCERAELDKESQMEAHEERWRQFLLIVWEEERMMRLPVAMGQVSCSTDLDILVRSTAISVLAQYGDGPSLGTTTTPLLLDQIASKLVTALEWTKFPRHACPVQNKASIL